MTDPVPYQRTLGDRLRKMRQSLGLSLADVDGKSNGQFKAVVIGSYERGDRAITVAPLASLAAFYGVPTAQLLPDTPDETAPQTRDERVAQHLREALALVAGEETERAEASA